MSNILRGIVQNKYFDAVVGIQNTQLEMLNMIQDMHCDILQLSKRNDEIVESMKQLQKNGIRKERVEEISSKVQHKISTSTKQQPRQAVFAAASKKNHVVQKFEKSERVANIIQKEIEKNILFQSCCDEELEEINHIFRPKEVEAGSVVIYQGDIGNEFYVVEEGTFEVYVDGVAVNVIKGPASFGELALLFGCNRCATIRAKDDCKLWYILQQDFRSITGNYKVKSLQKKVDILKKVKIKEKLLGDVLDPFDIDAIALATKRDKFRKDEEIVKEEEKNLCYMIEEGVVDVFNKGYRESPIDTLSAGALFGVKALFSDEVKQETYVAKSDVTVLFIVRDDLIRLIGDNMEKLLNQTTVNNQQNEAEKNISLDASTQNFFDRIWKLKYEDFETIKCMGSGAFSTVKLVKIKEDTTIGKELYDFSGSKTFALKSMDKEFLEQKGCLNYIQTEKQILGELNHPFIVRFYGEIQDAQTIYFLTEALVGGHLYNLIAEERCLKEDWSKFYSACVVSALGKIHSKKIAYRDLKPENIAIDSVGYIRIIDFGLAKKIKVGKAWTLCGTPEYLSPEVILSEGHDWAVDYWSLGVLIFEMVTGETPFHAGSEIDMYKKLLAGHFILPSNFSTDLEKLLQALIHVDQSKRLGRTKGGVKSIMQHSWFSTLDWKALEEKKLKVPILPKINRGDCEIMNDSSSTRFKVGRFSSVCKKSSFNANMRVCLSSDNFKYDRSSSQNSILRNRHLLERSTDDMVSTNNNHALPESIEHVKTSRRVSFSEQMKVTEKHEFTKKSSPVESYDGIFNCNDESSVPTNEEKLENDSICSLDYNKEQSASNVQLSSPPVDLPPNENLESMCPESNFDSFDMNLQNHSEKNNSFRKLFKMFGSLSSELERAKEDTDPTNTDDTKNEAIVKSGVIKNDVYINELFSKKTGNDLLRFDFVPSLELKSKRHSEKPKVRSKNMTPYKKGRETILQMQRMTDIISIADFDMLCSQHKSFSKFALISLRPDSLLSNKISDWGTNNLRPLTCLSADICDQFPMIDKDAFTREALNAFCFPEGLKMRIIPKCALERAGELGWFGCKSDRYQLHVFHDTSGEASYGISITTFEQITVPNLKDIKLYRSEHRACIKIVKWWRKHHLMKCTNENKLGSSRNSLTSSFNSISRKFSYTVTHREVVTFLQSFNCDDSLSDSFSNDTDENALLDFYGKRLMTEKSEKLAMESFKTMHENEKLGDVLIVERCYILVGTKPELTTLLFRSLQQLIDMERNEKESNTCTQRSNVLRAIRKQIALTDDQKSIDYPKSEWEFFQPKEIHEIDLLVEDYPSIKFSLPLPHLSKEWGVATLILRIKLPMLLILLKLILLERSVLVIGSSYEEVSSCTCALLDLLKPYKWVSTFIPVLPEGMFDIVNSPVPFICGVVSHEAGLEKIASDSRVREEMSLGLSVVNLNKGKVLMTQEDGITNTLQNCLSIVKLWNRSNQLSYFQERLEQLAANESSSLHSFKSFCQNGALPEESLTLHSIRTSIKKNLSNLSGIVSQYADGWKSCAGFKKETNEIVYHPSKFINLIKRQLMFQEEFFQTQLVTNYFEDRKNLYLQRKKDVEGKAAIFISNWLHFKWKFKKNKVDKKMLIALMRKNVIGLKHSQSNM